ncbi:ANTAR domain-containing protein [Arthrobacter sp. ISL-85]|uniref:ANTAR domain-containing protein n=1 Tax=Arthrobacter sp. ISL-85 TaxID=2819115 RepID=UPI001BE6BBD4|nr:ANTAR domain-containing protein [Arthrobacter sp. ISL-85]
MSGELAQALTNRDAISKAQGIIIERMNLNCEEAIDLLLAHSRRESTPLHEVARDILHKSYPRVEGSSEENLLEP